MDNVTQEKEFEKLKDAVKELGVNLEDFEVLKENNKEFIKYTDPDTKQTEVVENLDYSHSIEEQFKTALKNYNFEAGQSEKENARNVFKFLKKYSKKELNFIEISSLGDFKNNNLVLTDKFNIVTQGFDLKRVEELKYVIKISKILPVPLKYINIENMLAINEKNRTISVNYNYNSNNFDVKFVESIRFSNKSDEFFDSNLDLSSIDFDSLIEELEKSENKEIKVAGEVIKIEEIKPYTELTEEETTKVMDYNKSLSPRKKHILLLLVAAYRKRMNAKNLQNQNTYQKKLMPNKPYLNNNGFIDIALFFLTILTSALSIVTIMMFVIKASL